MTNLFIRKKLSPLVLIASMAIVFLWIKTPLTDYHVKNNQWKYREGYHIGDIIDFKNAMYRINSNKVIYKDNEMSGKIVEVGVRSITLKSVQGEVGIYVRF